MFEAITTSNSTIALIVACMAIFLFASAACDSFGASFWVTLIGLALLQFFTLANPVGFVVAHPWPMAIAAAAYLPVGVGWSVFRWWRLLQSAASSLKKEKATWKSSGWYKTWDEYVTSQLPRASSSKDRIIYWITYWPFSVAAYLLIDLLRDVGEWVYAKISGMYTAMVDKVKASLID